MKIVLQRFLTADVIIGDKIHSSIDQGLLILLGIQKADTIKDIEYLAKKIVKLRIFNDNKNKMNLSIMDLNFSIMLISQFTLYGDINKGNRPSFINAAKPAAAKPLYTLFIKELEKYNIKIKTGQFGAHMQVKFINDGPVTIILES